MEILKIFILFSGILFISLMGLNFIKDRNRNRKNRF